MHSELQKQLRGNKLNNLIAENIEYNSLKPYRKGKSAVSFLYDTYNSGIKDKLRNTTTLDPYESLNRLQYQCLQCLDELFKLNPKMADENFNLLFQKKGDIKFIQLLTKDEANERFKHLKLLIDYLVPYFMHSSVKLCFEYLIQAYEIHIYLSEYIFFSLLPYHDTGLFARMVQILEMNESSQFFGIANAIKKTRTPIISRSTLSVYLLRNIDAFRVLVNFWQNQLSKYSSTKNIPLTNLVTWLIAEMIEELPITKDKNSEKIEAYLRLIIEDIVLDTCIRKPHYEELRCAGYCILFKLAQISIPLSLDAQNNVVKSIFASIFSKKGYQYILRNLPETLVLLNKWLYHFGTLDKLEFWDFEVTRYILEHQQDFIDAITFLLKWDSEILYVIVMIIKSVIRFQDENKNSIKFIFNLISCLNSSENNINRMGEVYIQALILCIIDLYQVVDNYDSLNIIMDKLNKSNTKDISAAISFALKVCSHQNNGDMGNGLNSLQRCFNSFIIHSRNKSNENLEDDIQEGNLNTLISLLSSPNDAIQSSCFDIIYNMIVKLKSQIFRKEDINISILQMNIFDIAIEHFLSLNYSSQESIDRYNRLIELDFLLDIANYLDSTQLNSNNWRCTYILKCMIEYLSNSTSISLNKLINIKLKTDFLSFESLFINSLNNVNKNFKENIMSTLLNIKKLLTYMNERTHNSWSTMTSIEYIYKGKPLMPILFNLSRISSIPEISQISNDIIELLFPDNQSYLANILNTNQWTDSQIINLLFLLDEIKDSTNENDGIHNSTNIQKAEERSLIKNLIDECESTHINNNSNKYSDSNYRTGVNKIGIYLMKGKIIKILELLYIKLYSIIAKYVSNAKNESNIGGKIIISLLRFVMIKCILPKTGLTSRILVISLIDTLDVTMRIQSGEILRLPLSHILQSGYDTEEIIIEVIKVYLKALGSSEGNIFNLSTLEHFSNSLFGSPIFYQVIISHCYTVLEILVQRLRLVSDGKDVYEDIQKKYKTDKLTMIMLMFAVFSLSGILQETSTQQRIASIKLCRFLKGELSALSNLEYINISVILEAILGVEKFRRIQTNPNEILIQKISKKSIRVSNIEEFMDIILTNQVDIISSSKRLNTICSYDNVDSNKLCDISYLYFGILIGLFTYISEDSNEKLEDNIDLGMINFWKLQIIGLVIDITFLDFLADCISSSFSHTIKSSSNQSYISIDSTTSIVVSIYRDLLEKICKSSEEINLNSVETLNDYNQIIKIQMTCIFKPISSISSKKLSDPKLAADIESILRQTFSSTHIWNCLTDDEVVEVISVYLEFAKVNGFKIEELLIFVDISFSICLKLLQYCLYKNQIQIQFTSSLFEFLSQQNIVGSCKLNNEKHLSESISCCCEIIQSCFDIIKEVNPQITDVAGEFTSNSHIHSAILNVVGNLLNCNRHILDITEETEELTLRCIEVYIGYHNRNIGEIEASNLNQNQTVHSSIFAQSPIIVSSLIYLLVNIISNKSYNKLNFNRSVNIVSFIYKWVLVNLPSNRTEWIPSSFKFPLQTYISRISPSHSHLTKVILFKVLVNPLVSDIVNNNNSINLKNFIKNIESISDIVYLSSNDNKSEYNIMGIKNFEDLGNETTKSLELKTDYYLNSTKSSEHTNILSNTYHPQTFVNCFNYGIALGFTILLKHYSVKFIRIENIGLFISPINAAMINYSKEKPYELLDNIVDLLILKSKQNYKGSMDLLNYFSTLLDIILKDEVIHPLLLDSVVYFIYKSINRISEINKGSDDNSEYKRISIIDLSNIVTELIALESRMESKIFKKLFKNTCNVHNKRNTSDFSSLKAIQTSYDSTTNGYMELFEENEYSHLIQNRELFSSNVLRKIRKSLHFLTSNILKGVTAGDLILTLIPHILELCTTKFRNSFINSTQVIGYSIFERYYSKYICENSFLYLMEASAICKGEIQNYISSIPKSNQSHIRKSLISGFCDSIQCLLTYLYSLLPEMINRTDDKEVRSKRSIWIKGWCCTVDMFEIFESTCKSEIINVTMPIIVRIFQIKVTDSLLMLPVIKFMIRLVNTDDRNSIKSKLKNKNRTYLPKVDQIFINDPLVVENMDLIMEVLVEILSLLIKDFSNDPTIYIQMTPFINLLNILMDTEIGSLFIISNLTRKFLLDILCTETFMVKIDVSFLYELIISELKNNNKDTKDNINQKSKLKIMDHSGIYSYYIHMIYKKYKDDPYTSEMLRLLILFSKVALPIDSFLPNICSIMEELSSKLFLCIKENNSSMKIQKQISFLLWISSFGIVMKDPKTISKNCGFVQEASGLILLIINLLIISISQSYYKYQSLIKDEDNELRKEIIVSKYLSSTLGSGLETTHGFIHSNWLDDDLSRQSIYISKNTSTQNSSSLIEKNKCNNLAGNYWLIEGALTTLTSSFVLKLNGKQLREFIQLVKRLIHRNNQSKLSEIVEKEKQKKKEALHTSGFQLSKPDFDFTRTAYNSNSSNSGLTKEYSIRDIYSCRLWVLIITSIIEFLGDFGIYCIIEDFAMDLKCIIDMIQSQALSCVQNIILDQYKDENKGWKEIKRDIKFKTRKFMVLNHFKYGGWYWYDVGIYCMVLIKVIFLNLTQESDLNSGTKDIPIEIEENLITSMITNIEMYALFDKNTYQDISGCGYQWNILLQKSWISCIKALRGHDLVLENLIQSFTERLTSSNETIRLNSVKILLELWKDEICGFTLLPFISHILPGIAELQNDYSEVIIETTKLLIKEIEDRTGQSISEHLKK
ncbi:HEAT repeat family protein [Cryptosporidium muris RN66]|uniref:HEAT repeat-containing protein 1 n=1 Tax=Cryptosporidium muris (strain RN66) TaxID=441375 RepID=B6AFA4_CRYMR|nr:HEAT repeat family protein [Cryptosporidium muris RN66]EEA06895.1 HEAT repeat family protein [Cryptosporidium muris RN66]|eukprot:XP_002141244.1 HEAT repeat family protein [Cryptosporidium muris RN66]